MSKCRVDRLHRIALEVPDMAAAMAFYRNVWKLEDKGHERGFAALRTATPDHNDLLLMQGEPGIHHVCFSVSSATALRTLTDELAAAGVAVRTLGTDELFSGDCEGMECLDPDGRAIRIVVAEGGERRTQTSALADDPLAPREIGHVVLWTPDQPRAEAFYARLGFQVTDRTHLNMSFLRCNRDHHTLALVASKTGKTGIQHIAFDVVTIDNVMRNYARLRDQGQDCIWGVGRHGPGNNIFSYYQDPAGNFVEYFAEMDPQPEEFPTEEIFWGPEHKGDIWGVAGRPPATFSQ